MKIEWYLFALHCRDASDQGMTSNNRECWVPETAKILAKQDLEDALRHLTKATALIGYSLVKNTELPNEVSK